MLAFAFLIMLISIAVTFLSCRLAAGTAKTLRDGVFTKVVSFSNREFEKFSTASLITRSTNDIQQVQMVLTLFFRMVLYAPILGIGGVIHALETSRSMAWVILLAVVLVLGVVAVLFAITLPRFKKLQDLIDRLNLVTREILQGLPVIRAFSREKQEEQRFDKANKDFISTNLFVNRCMTFMMPAMMLVMNEITVLIVWTGSKGIDAGTMQVGDMMAYIQYTMMIIMSFLMITMMSIMLPRASVSAGRINEILKRSDPSGSGAGRESRCGEKGVVEFRHVSFAYPGAADPVLQDIDFTARPGETTAIIGSTGCGKSTLVNLIPRFYDVTEGEILVDGVDVRKMKQHTLHEKLGYVPQKGVLFSGTIASNIAYSKDAMGENNIHKAADIAQASDFIEEKEEQYDSPIAQGGTNVSGGQKQRLSIARAIAGKPEIYIFDDSFSALDYKTDAALRKALKEETAQATTIIVAQRISTILHAEQIIVLDEGRIAGIGTHKELLKSCEVYHQIAASQLSKEELDHE
ncbi:MAG: ABC transporter ATP-binding protein [Blautia sp.]